MKTEWFVKVTAECERQLDELIRRNKFSEDDARVIRAWTQLVIEHGPEILKTQPSVWADHALEGEWEGHRASSYSYSGRIIYSVHEKIVTVKVVRITPDHNYRK